MKTKLFFTALLIAFTQSIYAQTTSIPDSNFEQALIDLGIDSDGIINGQVFTADIENVLTLDVSNKEISDLTGIEGFNSLEELECNFNQLTSLDLSQNTEIIFLNTSYNSLESIDLTSLTVLEYLLCDSNQLTSLDVSHNTELKSLECGANNLTTLDLSYNLLLDDLACSENQLISLDATQNVALTKLLCQDNPLLKVLNITE